MLKNYFHYDEKKKYLVEKKISSSKNEISYS